ncbi:Ribosomal RNA small subunit methyltransferase NEP1 [Hondaea fermentalgiana]|uniref:Ribosomal RNA small subunit methyltransferase NEP1 n=1 Tax=Hondaea fermentalgiana TaxID=2315210 RepID=A0A2R5GQ73_9STRA|nr:Ribosomal RNA small subunit methyltransferase NEP1 [Hondaea fermentalgiana]|eukprot:GBG30501.1 Ribosomal RNA small subunit methyltransferase NEP1 [Hondaea fermentalgiana]
MAARKGESRRKRSAQERDAQDKAADKEKEEVREDQVEDEEQDSDNDSGDEKAQKQTDKADSDINDEEEDEDEDEDEDEAQEEEEGEPEAKRARTSGNTRKVIVIIDDATLEPVKTSKGSYELLNCDDHIGLHKKLNKDMKRSRPDISHQMLLALLDSPLNKAGHLKIYIRTCQNILIEVSEHLRVPRTYKRFAGLMVQLLHKMKIRAVDGKKTLLKVVKNPVTRHLPPDARIFGMSVTGTLVDVHEFVPALDDSRPVVFIFGGFAHGHIQSDYAEAHLSVSEYPLSGACAVSRVMNAFEHKWNII